jgi:hypothetical protein
MRALAPCTAPAAKSSQSRVRARLPRHCHHVLPARPRLPLNVAQMMFGLALCYFGGTFVTTIAAAEAFRTMGYEKARDDLTSLWLQIKPVLEANDEDDLKDDDGDGVADVDQLTPPELLQRKALLVLTTVKEPEKVRARVLCGLWHCGCGPPCCVIRA